MRNLAGVACLNLAIGVILGAFGAHSLKATLSPEELAVFQTGTHYHLAHALGMLLLSSQGIAALKNPAWLMQLGIVLFSGSLYVLAISHQRAWGMVTPLGGVCFIASWLWSAAIFFKHEKA